MRRVFLDSNIFVVTWVLDIILSLCDAGLMEPAWSDAVFNEFERVAEAMGRETSAHLIMQDLIRAYPHSNIVTWQHKPESFHLPDPDDEHVLAAALEGECDCIITYNLKDFPESHVKGLAIRIIHPDELLKNVALENPRATLEAMKQLVANKTRPTRNMDEEIEGLKKCRLPRFSAWLEEALASE